MAVPVFTKKVTIGVDYDDVAATVTTVAITIDGVVADVSYDYGGDIDPETKRTDIEADLTDKGYIWSA